MSRLADELRRSLAQRAVLRYTIALEVDGVMQRVDNLDAEMAKEWLWSHLTAYGGTVLSSQWRIREFTPIVTVDAAPVEWALRRQGLEP